MGFLKDASCRADWLRVLLGWMSAPSSECSDWSLISRSMRSISSPSLLPVGGGRFSAVGCAPGWSVSSGFWPEEALSACAARLPGVSKSSLLPLRALVVPRGALLLAFAVKANISFIWSSIAVSAVTVDTFPAGVLSALASTGVPSLASLSVLAAVDPGLLLGQLLMFYPIEVFFFLGHGLLEGCVLPSGLASRSSWVDVSTVVRVIGLVANIQVDALDFFSFVAPGRSSIARSFEIKSSTAAGSCGSVRGFAPGLRH
ncbi:hypothetical protein F2Q69_00060066 [Brassica cretica]|uniref:Uncharacterized protein n=1 Tax=Brassica cretica TaxID=69181 RepID=A0A8S9RF35_BRACR|nr:hypothetical protein F2Q69_00060066 [Brassica cretica]